MSLLIFEKQLLIYIFVLLIGLKFPNETFGSCSIPSAVWQVDPFGHSREQASLFARMGFEFLFLGRIDYNDKSTRLAAKQMEMMWKVSDSLKDLKLFTGILYNTYSPPSTFCFDIMCGDEPIVDDPNSPMFNIDRRVTWYSFYETLSALSNKLYIFI